MTTLIRAQGPRELLAYVPFRLGYRPQDSVVRVGLRPPRGRRGRVGRGVGGAAAGGGRGPQLARSVVGHLAADGARRVVLVVYSDAPLRAAGVAAARVRAAVEHCREAAEPHHGPVEAWVVSSTGWYALDCAEDDCCPPEGRSLRELESSEVGAHMVLSGAALADSREEALRIPPAGADARRRAARAGRRGRGRAGAGGGGGGGAGRGAGGGGGRGAGRTAVAQVVARDRARDGGPVDDGAGAAVPAATVLGRLAAGLESVPVRDAVLLSLVPGTDDLPDRTVRGGDVDAGTGRAIAAVVDPGAGLAPDPAVTGPARAVLEGVVAHAPRGSTAPALTLLALVAWWHGDGGRARRRLAEALAEDPTYRLALLLASALDAGVPPGWVRADACADTHDVG